MKKFIDLLVLICLMLMPQVSTAQNNTSDDLKDIAYNYVIEKIGSDFDGGNWHLWSSSYDRMPNGDNIVKIIIGKTLTYRDEIDIPEGATFFNPQRGFVTTNKIVKKRNEDKTRSYFVFIDKYGTPTNYALAPKDHVFKYIKGNPWFFMYKHEDIISNKSYSYHNLLYCYLSFASN